MVYLTWNMAQNIQVRAIYPFSTGTFISFFILLLFNTFLYPGFWPRLVRGDEDDTDAVPAAVGADEAVRPPEEHSRQVPRPRPQRARQLLPGLRGGGTNIFVDIKFFF